MSSHEVSTRELTNKLIQDQTTLLRNAPDFARALETSSDSLVNLEKTLSTSVKDYLQSVLDLWVNTKGREATVFKLITILEQEKYQDAADKLWDNYTQELIGRDHKTIHLAKLKITQGPSSSLPKPVKNQVWYNVGSNVTTNIKQSEEVLTDHKVLITGHANTGKTELARHFAKKLYENYNFSCVCLHGKDLQMEIFKFMEYCEVNEYLRSFRTISELFQGRQWLLIFDGVNENQEYLRTILNEIDNIPGNIDPPKFIVVTSRHSELPTNPRKSFHLD